MSMDRLAAAVRWKLLAASLLTVAAILYVLVAGMLRPPVTLTPPGGPAVVTHATDPGPARRLISPLRFA